MVKFPPTILERILLWKTRKNKCQKNILESKNTKPESLRVLNRKVSVTRNSEWTERDTKGG